MKNIYYLFIISLSLLIMVSCSTETTPVYTLSTSVSNTEAGSIDPSNGEFNEGTEIEITATPNNNWIFESWKGGHSGSGNPATLTMDQDKQITALFIKLKYPLSKEIEGEGQIYERIVRQKTTEHEPGTLVELVADPADGWQFSHWENDLEGDESPATIEMDGEKHVKAVFEERKMDLNLFREGNGSVDKKLVTGSENEDGQYEYDSVVELVAAPDAEWKFSHWEGDLTGTDNEVEVTLDADKNIVAVFQAEESNEVNLLVGDSHTQAFPGGSVILPDEPGAVFRVGVMARDYQKNGSTVFGVPNDLMLNVREVGSGPAKSSSITHRDPHQTPYRDDRIDDDTWKLMQRTQEVHRELRETEKNQDVRGMQYTLTGESSRLSTAGSMKVNSESEPEESRTFFTNNPDGGERIEIEATLRKNGTNIIYYQDDSVEGTTEEATDQEIEELLEYYDQHGKPLIDEMFGGLGPDGTTNHFSGGERKANDIDGNGKFIVLQLHADNMIGGAAGYVSSCDRFPLEENYNAGPYYCEKSNEAEITYLLRPDSDFFLGALVHEAKHISSHGYAVFTDREFQPSWMEEGTAEIANEMTSRRASGIADYREVTFSEIYPGGSTTALTDAMASVNARARNFLYASPENGVIGDPSESSSNYYGSGWLFHRYLADNYAENNQNQFFRGLNDGTHGADLQSLTTVTGKDFDELLDEFVTAIQIEGKMDAKNNSSISFNSYDFEEIASHFSMGDWPYLYEESTYQSREVVLSPVYYTSPVLFEFTSPGGSTLELELQDGDGESLNAEHDAALIITRVE